MFGMLVWAQTRFMQYEQTIAELHVDIEIEKETTQKLMSRGRWIRSYDSSTGYSSYRWARNNEQR